MKIESINPLLLGEDPLVFDATKALKTEAVPAKNELGNRETRSDQGRYHVLLLLLCFPRFSRFSRFFRYFWEAIFSKPFKSTMTNSPPHVPIASLLPTLPPLLPLFLGSYFFKAVQT